MRLLAFIVLFCMLAGAATAVQITSTADTDATVGQAYAYAVTATDAENDTITFSLITSPTGMAINAVSGLITWTPTAAGDFSVVVRATDNTSAFDDDSFTIHVVSTRGVLDIADITIGNEDQERVAGVSKTFTISNTGGSPITNVVLTSTINSAYNATFINVPTALDAGAIATVTVTITIPEDQDSGMQSIGNILISGTSGGQTVQDGASVSLTTVTHLIVDRVKIYNQEEDDEDTVNSNGDDIKAKAGQTLVFTVKVKNTFDENIDINDVNVKVRSDGDLDFDDDADASDLQSDDDTDEVEFTFTIDQDIDEDSYWVEVSATGEDDNGATHKDTLRFDVDINKENDEISIQDVVLTPVTISCSRTARLDVTIENTGSRDQSKVTLEVDSNDINYYKRIQNIELDQSDDVKKSFDIVVPTSVQPGTYSIEVNTYYDTNKESDNDIATLTVQACGSQPDDEETPPENDTSGDTGAGGVIIQPGQSTFVNPVYGQEPSAISQLNPWYLGMLIAIAVLLVIFIILLLAKLL